MNRGARFLQQSTSIDLEVDEHGELFAIGAFTGNEVFARFGKAACACSFSLLDKFAADSQYLLGHNVISHDLGVLRGLAPTLELLDKPVIDTLYLSPLAFPHNPYHRLVKNYKLVRDALNDPVADARLAATLFSDQCEAFASMPEALLRFYHFCFSADQRFSGLVELFSALRAESTGSHTPISDHPEQPPAAARQTGETTLYPFTSGKSANHHTLADGRAADWQTDSETIADSFRKLTAGKVCITARERIIKGHLHGVGENASTSDTPNPPLVLALAYSAAWLQAAGGNSVLPPWVRHEFPHTVSLLRQLRDVPCHDPACSWCCEVHHPEKQLQAWFDFPSFRAEPATDDGKSLQREIVAHALHDEPVLGILPTGGGKSLCYQLPALARYQRRGVLSIVISPLQALMKDQVDNLRLKTGTQAVAALYGLLTPPERGAVLEGIRLGDIGILYVSPEQLRNRSFAEAISQRDIGCWVFDEAHCLSKWGHDFRPDYLYAGRFIKEIAAKQKAAIAPVQCFTATARIDVKQEIQDFFRRTLGQQLRLFEGGVERDNLSFEVHSVSRNEKLGRLHDILKEHLQDNEGAGIVYCSTRKRTEQTAEFLQQQEWRAEAFHAGLDAALKRSIQERFIDGEIRVICATNAFGMGIDKENVRVVVHADIPGSLENYLQEAGRAGRDQQQADCVLLYDEDDIEGQFRLGAQSELKKKDIAQLLRGLRFSANKSDSGEITITSGELLRSQNVDASFGSDDRNAQTKVITAVAWLERAGLLERNENRTQVFQGMPSVRTLDEAKQKIARLELSERQQQRWLAILETLINADSDDGFSADQLVELAPLAGNKDDPDKETESQRVIRTLHDMSKVGIIRQSMMLTAFVRYKVSNPSRKFLKKIIALEKAMLRLLQEEAPDAEHGEWQQLSLRRLNQRLLDQGLEESNANLLRLMLYVLSRDGRGLAGREGSLELRHHGQDSYQIRLMRGWQALRATAERRQAVASVVLQAILHKIPADTTPSAGLLVEFSLDDCATAIDQDLTLKSTLKDPLAAIDRALLYLHEMQVIILQNGLAIFRQSMTIKVMPEKRRYTNADFEPLAHYYHERVFQVHVINEYARKGLEQIRTALELVLAYFSMDKNAFVKRFFPGQKTILERATSQQSWERIVEDLGNPQQKAIVTAPEESNILVLAGPGSGKTRVVVHRCGWLLRVQRVRPESILLVCFNRNAATLLRRRLFELVGQDSYGVTIHTYHGLAMRLTGHSIEASVEAHADAEPDFDAVIREAIALLKGEKEMLGIEADEVRDRLLAGYRHILVDEYQDIDTLQYELVSAIAGRTLEDSDSKLNLMAVGDDDQNIYQFRGANVGFIRQFQQDYGAKLFYLDENYRSTAHIIEASNQLIAQNQDRMKHNHPIVINADRAQLPPGGNWSQLDQLGKGRVQILEAGYTNPVARKSAAPSGEIPPISSRSRQTVRTPDSANTTPTALHGANAQATQTNGFDTRLLEVPASQHQAAVLMEEMLRLKSLSPAWRWENVAVLAREWSLLEPLRTLCESQQIPVRSYFPKRPPLYRIREIGLFLQALHEARKEWLDFDELQGLLAGLQQQAAMDNVWWLLLRRIGTDWKNEAGTGKQPVMRINQFFYESLAEHRQTRLFGEGLLLSTVHSAKGLEYDHVFILDGGWLRNSNELEDTRRLYYVAMTRARQTLTLFEMQNSFGSLIADLHGDSIHRRTGYASEQYQNAIKPLRYTLLTLDDFFLSYAGGLHAENPIHQALRELNVGDNVTLQAEREQIGVYANGVKIAVFSKKACQQWNTRLFSIISAKIIALATWRKQDSEPAYQRRCKIDCWEVPLLEICHEAI